MLITKRALSWVSKALPKTKRDNSIDGIMINNKCAWATDGCRAHAIGDTNYASTPNEEAIPDHNMSTFNRMWYRNENLVWCNIINGYLKRIKNTSNRFESATIYEKNSNIYMSMDGIDILLYGSVECDINDNDRKIIEIQPQFIFDSLCMLDEPSMSLFIDDENTLLINGKVDNIPARSILMGIRSR